MDDRAMQGPKRIRGTSAPFLYHGESGTYPTYCQCYFLIIYTERQSDYFKITEGGIIRFQSLMAIRKGETVASYTHLQVGLNSQPIRNALNSLKSALISTDCFGFPSRDFT